MSDNWHETTVEEIKAKSPNSLATGPFGSAIGSRFFQDSGVPVIRGSNLSEDVGTRLIHEDMVFVSEVKAQEFARSAARRGDLIFTCWGTIGQVGLIDSRCPYDGYIISNKQMKLTPAIDRVDSLFLYYLFSGPDMSQRIRGQAIGSLVPGFNLGQLRALRLRLPPLKEQQAIAATLGALDDRIELNRRMNETLEAMGRATFKSWFVDFDPVRAKAEGRQPAGIEAQTAALFPDSFEHSSTGSIPSGWSVRTLADICTTQYGYTASATKNPVGPKFLRVMDINKRNWIEWASVPHCSINERERAKHALGVGDVVVARMADPGKAAIIEEPVDAVFASYLVRLQTSSLALSYFVYGHLKSAAYADYANAVMSGSVQKNMNARVIAGSRLAVPPQDVLEAFASVVIPLRRRLVAAVTESAILADLRNTLLPKLLSGEIRVRETERQLEATL